MKINKLGSAIAALAVVVAVLALSACQPATQEETVEERSQARWDAFVEREFASAWDYYTPGFRQTTIREEFAADMANRPMRWLDAAVRGAECDGDRCTVSVSVTYQPTGASGPQRQMRMTRDLEEQWIRIDGQWWYVRN